jgi:hypothetical protein
MPSEKVEQESGHRVIPDDRPRRLVATGHSAGSIGDGPLESLVDADCFYELLGA